MTNMKIVINKYQYPKGTNLKMKDAFHYLLPKSSRIQVSHYELRCNKGQVEHCRRCTHGDQLIDTDNINHCTSFPGDSKVSGVPIWEEYENHKE